MKKAILFLGALGGAAVFFASLSLATTGTDQNASKTTGLSGPYEYAAAVTPHDTNELAIYSSALYVGSAGGTVKVTTVKGSVVTFTAVPIGILPVRAKIVWSTGTTSTTIIALY